MQAVHWLTEMHVSSVWMDSMYTHGLIAAITHRQYDTTKKLLLGCEIDPCVELFEEAIRTNDIRCLRLLCTRYTEYSDQLYDAMVASLVDGFDTADAAQYVLFDRQPPADAKTRTQCLEAAIESGCVDVVLLLLARGLVPSDYRIRQGDRTMQRLVVSYIKKHRTGHVETMIDEHLPIPMINQLVQRYTA